MRKLLLLIALAIAFQAFAERQNSIFSQGNWYHFSTDFTQPAQKVVRLTYEKLSNSGVNMENVNPDKMKLLMMPPGLMSEEVNYENINPLKEIPVKLYGCDDGTFDEGDYLLFYPVSQMQWNYDSAHGYYLGSIHPYTDKINYFLQTDAPEDGLRVGEIPLLDEQADMVIQHTQKLAGSFRGILNPVNAGAEFVIQDITNENFTYEVSGQLTDWPAAKLVFRVVTGSNDSTEVRLLKNGSELATFDVPGSESPIFTQHLFSVEDISVTDGDVFTVEYMGSASKNEADVYLDDFSIQGMEEISSSGLLFNPSQPHGEVTAWEGPWNDNTEIWNLTDIYTVAQQITNDENVFRTNSQVREKFVAFNPETSEGIQDFEEEIVPVDFDDLYALDTPDVMVVTNENLAAEAVNYAAIHANEGLSVEVVDIQSIYNNFSGGIIDFTAIRNFMAYHYIESDGALDYLTIYGDAAVYPGDDRFVVPAYQTTEVWGEYMLEAGDRYFGYLDDSEDFLSSESDMDIAVGRIPVANREEAEIFNEKLSAYKQDVGANQISITLAADDEDNGVHMDKQEQTAETMYNQAKCMNVHKVYLDDYPQEMQGEQQVSPDAQQAISQAFERGDVMVDFMGHAGHSTWAHEDLLTGDVVGNLTNTHYPFVIFTARQDFFHPESASLSEMSLLQQHGAIGCMASTQTSFVQAWSNFKATFYQAVFEEGIVSHGMAMKYAYNHVSGTSLGSYCLLGDPVMSFPFPEYEILTETVNDMAVESVDSLFINELYTLAASVYDDNGVVEDFNGTAQVKVFAPVHQQQTLGTDQAPFAFVVSDSLLSDQEVVVNNGSFEATFSLPSNYDFSPGDIKISYHAQNESYSAAGYEYLFSVSEPSGFDEEENVRFKVYPTITSSDIIIRIGTQNILSQSYLEVLSMKGNCLYRKKITSSKDSRFHLSMKDYPSGMYIVRLLGKSFSKTVKVIRK